ncbi:hypothetical protein [Streptomyces sp. VRA16 Mangrove soil]|uniref:hypothetical protein n=1 Tax=Streptomyces sp. VRA16 Mangrove soil TaxID=2817434 RepID=UPI001A9EE49B|nr:hypothetical protein [Streptomyces sp. VRA16 Mangrove soil]MBO1334345.1 hypothetical protein [Streptomyces sp. VRA16 Mangrove soil]
MTFQKIRVNPQLVIAAAITLLALLAVTVNTSARPGTESVPDQDTESDIVYMKGTEAQSASAAP